MNSRSQWGIVLAGGDGARLRSTGSPRSRFQPYYQLADYLAAYTDWMVGLAVGQPSLKEIADGKYYTDLPGGALESMGRLFKRSRIPRPRPRVGRDS